MPSRWRLSSFDFWIKPTASAVGYERIKNKGLQPRVVRADVKEVPGPKGHTLLLPFVGLKPHA